MGGYQDVLSKHFCLTMPKTFNFCKITICFVFQKTSGSEIFMDRRGVSRVSVEFFLSHIAGNFRKEPCCVVFRKNLAAKKIKEHKGGYQDLPSKFFLSDSA